MPVLGSKHICPSWENKGKEILACKAMSITMSPSVMTMSCESSQHQQALTQKQSIIMYEIAMLFSQIIDC